MILEAESSPLELLSRQAFEHRLVPSARFFHEPFGKLGRGRRRNAGLPRLVELRLVAFGGEPVPDGLLVVALLSLPGLVLGRGPHPELVWAYGVAQEDAASVPAELQLDVGEDEPGARRPRPDELVDLNRGPPDSGELCGGGQPLADYLLLRYGLVLQVRLRRRVEVGLWELCRQDRLDGQRHLPLLRPVHQAPVEVASDHALHHYHVHLLHHHRVFTRQPDHVVGHAQGLEEVRAQLAEDLSLVGNGRRKHNVVGRDPIGEAEEQMPFVELVDVLHLARADEPAGPAHLHISLIFARRVAKARSSSARICAARMPPFRALSIPTQPTGTPAGIWTIERRESRPPSLALTGTPITGLRVIDATTPGRWADRPAMAMKTLAGDEATYCFSPSGSLWAEMNLTSKETPSSCRTFAASSATAWSLLLPATMATLGDSATGSPSEAQDPP